MRWQLAFEAYHQLTNGVNFYGEGDLFEGGGLLEGLDLVRTPLTETPQGLPPRPDSCDADAVWDVLGECMRVAPESRPTFAQVATRLSAARQSSSAQPSDWL